MSYLKEEEIPTYCNLVNGVTISQVEAASFLIDSFVGSTFKATKYQEKVNFSKTPTKRNYMQDYRAKLKHLPRIEINSVETTVKTIFGQRDKLVFETECLEFDSPNSLYFSFFPPYKPFMLENPVIKNLDVTYTAGYEEDNYPEALKRAVGMLACNLKQVGGTLKWQSRDDYDVKVTLSSEGVFTNEIKNLVKSVPLL